MEHTGTLAEWNTPEHWRNGTHRAVWIPIKSVIRFTQRVNQAGLMMPVSPMLNQWQHRKQTHLCVQSVSKAKESEWPITTDERSKTNLLTINIICTSDDSTVAKFQPLTSIININNDINNDKITTSRQLKISANNSTKSSSPVATGVKSRNSHKQYTIIDVTNSNRDEKHDR